MIIQYWNSSISIGIWIAVFWVIFTAVNYVPVKWYGEMEYWFVSIKVITILGFLIFAVRNNLCNPVITTVEPLLRDTCGLGYRPRRLDTP